MESVIPKRKVEKVFTVRFDKPTFAKLAYLAGETHRSKANVIRWLIHTGFAEYNKEIPNWAEVDDDEERK